MAKNSYIEIWDGYSERNSIAARVYMEEIFWLKEMRPYFVEDANREFNNFDAINAAKRLEWFTGEAFSKCIQAMWEYRAWLRLENPEPISAFRW